MWKQLTLSSLFSLQSWTRNRTQGRALILGSKLSLFLTHGHACISHLLCDPRRSSKAWSHVTLMGSSSRHPAGLSSLSDLGENASLLRCFTLCRQCRRITFWFAPGSLHHLWVPRFPSLEVRALGLFSKSHSHRSGTRFTSTEPRTAWLIFFVEFLLLRTGIHYSASKQE